jgi:uncharacterized protein (TIGR03663 family)
MASITHTTETAPAPNWLAGMLNRPLALNLEIAAYVAIFLLAVFTRFYDLETRTMSHDESLHTWFSYDLYKNGNFQHTPLMHGPILFHAVAFSYYMFGDSDFAARIYPAVLGVLMVMFPLLFRKWLGRWGAVLAAIMILASPLLMYYNRYIREDTPSIFASLVMVWTAFMYMDGGEKYRGKFYWLYIFAAAMLWSLGSKESAFIYIAIFGSVLTLYWVIRLLQHYLNVDGRYWFYTIMISVLLAGVVALGMFVVLDITALESVWNAIVQGPNNATPINVSVASQTEVNFFFSWMIFCLAAGVVFAAASLAWALRDRSETAEPANWIDALALGVFAAGLVCGVVLNPLFWLIALGAAGYGFLRLGVQFVPVRTMVIVLLLGAIALTGMIIVEELSHVTATAEATAAAAPGDVTQATELSTDQGRPWLFYVQWAVAVLVIGVVVYGRLMGVFRDLHRFREFDVLMVMGTLILPWLTSLIVKAMGANAYSLPDIARVVAGVLGVSGVMNLSDFPTQVFLAFLTMLPMFAISIVMALCWRPRVWLITSAVFHLLFLFFFTTMFTNMAGVGTGMYGSLGYWLEQQAVRRGSQPQYYYLLIIMPIYEFLPIIGSVAAMGAGLTLYWRYVRQREDQLLIAEAQAYANPDTPPASAVESAPAASELPPDLATDQWPDDDGDDKETRKNNQVDAGVVRGTMQHVSFLLFTSWWAIFTIIGYTLAGEKMPWLGTHMTVPLILLTAWYMGDLLQKIEWQKVWQGAWLTLVLVPLAFVLAAFVLIPPIVDVSATGASRTNLLEVSRWVLVVGLLGGTGYLLYRLRQHFGTVTIWVLGGVSVFIFLTGLTARVALLASFRNHDYANEFLVYAHGGPANKEVAQEIAEMSMRTQNGYGIRLAYDNLMSWPGTWYFRPFYNQIFMGANPTVAQLQNADVVLVGGENVSKVAPILEENYYEFRRIRMWWPMQDYFGLTADRVNNILLFTTSQGQPTASQASRWQRAIFDIWWNRDYTAYDMVADGDREDYTLAEWPINNWMYVYIRRDFAQQVWSLGAGQNPQLVNNAATTSSQCVTNWQDLSANLVFGGNGSGPGQLNRPLQPVIAPEGSVYVPEENNNRISVFNSAGQFVTTIGQLGDRSMTGGIFLQRPNAVAVGPNGDLYIVDTWNFRIQEIDPNGLLVRLWGSEHLQGANAQTQPFDGFWGPRMVAIDPQGNVYVADTGNKRVRVYTASGTYIRDIGSAGSQPGQLEEPTGLAIDPINNELYVAEWWNRRVSVFTLSGAFVRTFRVRAWSEDFGNRAYLAYDPARSIVYVTDPDIGRILVYDRLGNCVGAFGQASDTLSTNSFVTIGGIALDSAGNVYVTDSGGGRVLRFAPFPINAVQIQPPAAGQGQQQQAPLMPMSTEEAQATAEAVG